MEALTALLFVSILLSCLCLQPNKELSSFEMMTAEKCHSNLMNGDEFVFRVRRKPD